MKYHVLLLLVLLAVSAQVFGACYIDFSTGKREGMEARPTADGQFTVGAADGVVCARSGEDPNSRMIYLDVTEPLPAGQRAFLIVKAYDSAGPVFVQYDGKNDAYTMSPDVHGQNGTGSLVTMVFILRDPVWSDRENGGHDLRINGINGSIAVKRVEVTLERPEDYIDPVEELDNMRPNVLNPGMTAIQQWQVHYRLNPEDLSDLTFERAKKLGITSMQSYVGLRQLEPQEGQPDFSVYDGLTGQLEKHGMKWLPFLIMAPEVSVPDWWNEKHGVFAKCLEHGEEAPVQSIWNPALREGVKRFLTMFREHYKPEVIEALNFGISGCWGESIQVVGGGFGIMDRHQHLGYWCGDEYARADLRRYLKDKYGSVAALNKAWKASFRSFEDVEPLIPGEKKYADRAVVDFHDWYYGSMTDLAEYWVKTARELYPDTPIYLCTGGDGNPMMGADFSDQARRIAPYGAGIRITNQGDNVFENFSVTRMVSSACRLYGQYYTTEPGGDNTPDGIVTRVFDATAGGAIGAYFKYLMDAPDLPNVRGIKFAEYNRYFRKQAPRLKVAALMPNTSLSLQPGIIYDFIRRSSLLRHAQDFEWLDENMIEDGLADRFSAIVLLAGQTYEQATLDRLEAWVKNGGVLFASNDLLPLINVEGEHCAWLKKSGQSSTPGIPEEYAAAAKKAKEDGADAEVMIPGADEQEEKALLSAAKPHGEGWTVVFPEGEPLYIGLVSACLYSEHAPWSDRCSLVNAGEPHPACLAARRIDGEFDDVISSVINTAEGKKVYYMNNSFEDVYKTLPGGREILVRARSIAETSLDEACLGQEFEYSPYSDPYGLPNPPDHRLDYACGGVSDYALVWEPDVEGSDWVILLHGHGSRADQPYTRPDVASHWLTRLKGRYGIVSFDTMGNGWMNPGCAANMHNMLCWLKKRFGVGEFALIGGSMGGTGALSYACQYPQDIDGVAALCACTDIKTYTEFLREAAARAPQPGVEEDILQAILRGFDDDPVKYEAVSPLTYSDRLSMPVFISHSTGDALIPVSNSQRLAAKLADKADFEYLEIEGGHHDTTLMPGFDRGMEFLTEHAALKSGGLRQYTDSLSSDNPSLNKAFDIALNDIWCNIRPYKGFDACLCAGFDYPTPWTRDTAINTRNAGYLYPQVVKNNLFSMTEIDASGRVLTDSIERPECSGNYWDSVIWTMGLWYCYLYTGDESLLREGYPVVKRTLEAYRKLEFNPDWGLFMGGGVYADGISAYPDHYREKDGQNPGIAWWARRNPDKAYPGTVSGDPMATLSTNCMYYISYALAAKMSDILGAGDGDKWLEEAASLKQAVIKTFRNGKKGSYDYLIDHMGKCDSQEALGISFAVLSGIADRADANMIFDHLKSTPWGVACVEPAFGRYKPDPDTFGRHCGTVWPFASMFVAEAAAKAGRGDVYSREVRLLTEMALRHDGFYEIYHPLTGEPYGGMQEPDKDKASWRSVPRQTWSATGYIRALTAGVFGLWYDEKGVTVQPVKHSLCTRAELRLPVRGLRLTLKYTAGDTPSVKIDGKEASFIPWSDAGSHTIEITG